MNETAFLLLQQLLQYRLQFAGLDDAAIPFDLEVAVDDQQARDQVNIVGLVNRAIVENRDMGLRQRMLLYVLPDIILGVIDENLDDRDLVLTEKVAGLGELGRLLLAARAPGRRQLQNEGVPFVIGKPDCVALQVSCLEARCRGTDREFRMHGRYGKGQQKDQQYQSKHSRSHNLTPG